MRLDKDLDSKEMQVLQKKRKEIEKENNIKPLAEFGTNYAEYYHDSSNAISKLLLEKQGQVAGAFHRKDLGDIDLVWGNVEIDSKGRIIGQGLAKIIEKHLKQGDFESFGKGEAGLINAMNEIIENGKIITENNIKTIWYKKDNEYYLIGLSQGYDRIGNNYWIITSYKKTRGHIPNEIK